MTRTRRSFWSYLSSVAFSLVTVAVAIVSTPLLLAWLGAERFGAYRAASDWGGYLSLLELGLGNALLPLLAWSLARSDKDGLRATVAAGIRAYSWMALAMLAGGIALGLILPWLVPVSAAVVSDLRRGYWIGLLAILLVPLSPFRLLAEAAQKAYVVNGLLILQSLLITGLALVLARAGWGIAGQFLAAVVGAVIFYILLARVGFPRMAVNGERIMVSGKPCHRPPLSTDNLPAAAEGKALQEKLWKLNRPTLIHGICGRISLLTDNIVIAALLGPAAVVPFFLTQRLALLAQGQLQGIGNASWAGLADLHAKGERESFADRLLELTSLVAILGVACMAPILVYNQHFVRFWVSGSQFGGESLTVLAVVNGFLQAIFSLWGWAFSGTGQVARLVPILVVGTGINLGASILCTLLLGLPGPLLGTFVAFVAVYLWSMPLLLRNVFEISPGLLLKAVAWPLLLGLPYAVCVWWMACAHAPAGWVDLACEMTLAGGIYLLLAWWLVLGRSERTFWRQRARLVFARGSSV